MQEHVGSSPGGVVARSGMLLVAAPGLNDPNFAESVVLLLDVDNGGALGVVINRPSPVPVSEVLGDWSELVGQPDVLFRGGPVSTEGALAVARISDPTHEAAAPVGWQQMHGAIGLLDLDTPTELVVSGITGLRIFAGYAGWGVGQLESEIEDGGWYVVPAEAGDAFSVEPAELWRTVLRRQPGELAWLSTRPADTALN